MWARIANPRYRETGYVDLSKNADFQTIKDQNLNFKVESGTIKPTGTGEPNSVYKYAGGRTDGTFKSHTFYNSESKAIFQLDLQKHGNWQFGHGHNISIPGNLGSGHILSNHVAPMLVPYKFLNH